MLNKAIKFCIEKITGILPVQSKMYLVLYLRGFANVVEKICYIPSFMQAKIKRAISASNSGRYEKAERILLQIAVHNPDSLKFIAPHLSRVRFLKARFADKDVQHQNHRMLTAINSMNREIKSNPIYIPGEYWNTVGKDHIRLLEQYGIENFKRTVSHHYQNWFMCTQNDEQVRQLYKTWKVHRAIEPWFNIIEVPDNVGMSDADYFTYPLAVEENREIYRIAVGLLWEFVNKTDSFKILEKLNESEIGNPLRIWRKRRLISSDIAHSVRERNMLLKTLSLKGNERLIVGELGAGHGRLAEIFGITTNFRYFIFDITPAIFVSQWYIKKLFPNEKIFEFRHFDNFSEIEDELKKCRFAFFTSNQIEKLPNDYVNLFINLNSLAEMRLDQIKNFIHNIDRLTSTAFLSRQQIHSVNPVERISLSKANYKMPKRWQLILDKADDIYPSFFNQIWRR